MAIARKKVLIKPELKTGFVEIPFKEALTLYGEKEWILIPVAGGTSCRPKDLSDPFYLGKYTTKHKLNISGDNKMARVAKLKVEKESVEPKKKTAKRKPLSEKPESLSTEKKTVSKSSVKKTDADLIKEIVFNDSEKVRPYSKVISEIIKHPKLKMSVEEISEAIDEFYTEKLKVLGVEVIEKFLLKNNSDLDKTDESYLPRYTRVGNRLKDTFDKLKSERKGRGRPSTKNVEESEEAKPTRKAKRKNK